MTNSLESLGRLRLQALLILLAVFVIGGLAGVAVERARHPRPSSPPPRPGFPPHLRVELQLTAEQNRRLDEILAGYRPRTDELFDRIMPRVQALTDSMRAEIRAVLTPSQQEIFDRMEPPPDEHRHPPDGRRPPREPPPGGDWH
jgi:hypothetical protein